MSYGSSYVGYIQEDIQRSIISQHKEYLAAEQGSLLKEQTKKQLLTQIYNELHLRSGGFYKLAHRRKRLLFAIESLPDVEDLLVSMEEARVALYQARNVEFGDTILPGNIMSQASTYMTSRAKEKLDIARRKLDSVKAVVVKETFELIVYDSGTKLASIKSEIHKLEIEDRNIMQLELIDLAYDIFKQAIDITSAINTWNLDRQAKEVERAQRELLKVLEILYKYDPENYAVVHKELLDIQYDVWTEITRHVSLGQREGRRDW